MVKNKYAELKKEHPILPEYDSINKEFEISTIENKDFLLREIKRKIAEKYETLLNVLEHVISPDPGSMADIYECRAFTNGEKKIMFDVFKHLMEHYRMLLETDLLCEDEKDAETIKKTHEAWKQDRKQATPLVKKLRESWQKHIEPKEILEYLG